MKIDMTQFSDAINQFRTQVEKDATNNLVNAVSYILEEAKPNTPIDLGTLRENSDYYVKREGNTLKGFVGFMEFYAIYVHQGTGIFALNGDGRQTPWHWFGTTEKWAGWHMTRGQRPKRFLYDAVINNLDAIQEKLGG